MKFQELYRASGKPVAERRPGAAGVGAAVHPVHAAGQHHVGIRGVEHDGVHQAVLGVVGRPAVQARLRRRHEPQSEHHQQPGCLQLFQDTFLFG